MQTIHQVRTYIVWNFREKCQVGKPYKCRKRATARADKLDLEYGAYKYDVIEFKE